MKKTYPSQLQEQKVTNPNNVALTDEERMRILANYLIDRVLENKENNKIANKLKETDLNNHTKNNMLIMEHFSKT